MANVLNFFDPIAVQVQNIQLLKGIEVLDAVNLILAKHEDLRLSDRGPRITKRRT